MILFGLLAAAVAAASPLSEEQQNAVALARSSLDYCVMNATRDPRLARRGPKECVGWGERDCLDNLDRDLPTNIDMCARAERDAWIEKTDAFAEALALAAPNPRTAARIRAAQAGWAKKRAAAVRPGLEGLRATSRMCAERYGYLVSLAGD